MPSTEITKDNYRFENTVIFGLFFLSGCAALIYQVVWQRLLSLIIGVDIYAASLIVALFMGGLGLGSLAGGHIADRVKHRTLLLLFAAAELVVALFGLASKFFLYDFLSGTATTNSGTLSCLLAMSFLLVPTFCMGLSLPLLSKTISSVAEHIAKNIGFLYGLNTFGAAVGSLMSTAVLIRLIGLSGALVVAGILNIVVGIGAFFLLRSMNDEPSANKVETAELGTSTEQKPKQFAKYLCIYFISGLLALGLEIVWFRLLGVLLKSTSFTFSWMLFLYLSGLAFGTIFGARIIESVKKPLKVFLLLQAGVALYSALSLASLVYALTAKLLPSYIAGYLSYYEPMSSAALLHLEPTAVILYVIVCGLIVFVPTTLMGLSFNFLQKAAQTDVRTIGRKVGMLQFANILGSMLGATLVGVWLLNYGTSVTLRILASLSIVFLLAAFSDEKFDNNLKRIPIVVCCFVLPAAAILLVPHSADLWSAFHGTIGANVIACENATGLTVLDIRRGIRNPITVNVNGIGQSMLPFGEQLVHTQLGMIPVFIHPHPNRIGIIGLGSADTLFGANGCAEVKSIDCMELISSELQALKDLLAIKSDSALQKTLADPRLKMHFLDGRQFIRDNGKFDVLEADALRPRSAYSNNVYSREYFELLKRHLNKNGLAVTWIPTERVRQTFLSVFPYAVQNEEIIIGSAEPISLDKKAMLQRMRNLFSQKHFHSANIDGIRILESFEKEARSVKTDSNALASTNINTDLHPRDEFFSP